MVYIKIEIATCPVCREKVIQRNGTLDAHFMKVTLIGREPVDVYCFGSYRKMQYETRTTVPELPER